jgi:hypothetical protein
MVASYVSWKDYEVHAQKKKIRISFKNSIAILANKVTSPRYVIAGIQGKPQNEPEVLTSVTMKTTIFWVVTPCNSMQVH